MSSGPGEYGLLLRPSAVTFVLLDHQDDLLAALSPDVRDAVASSTLALGRIAKACSVPLIISNLSSAAFQGNTRTPLLKLFPQVSEVHREHMNCWDEQAFVSEVKAQGKDRLLLAGLWTETAITFAALSGLELGYQIYIVTDAMAGMTVSSHDVAIERMVQCSVVPVTWRQLLFEWYRMSGPEDGPVGQALLAIAREHGLVLGTPAPDNN